MTCIGADHVFGTQADAVGALHPLVRPGGVLLFGTGFWQRLPTAAEAAGLGAMPADCPNSPTFACLTLGVAVSTVNPCPSARPAEIR